MKSSIYFGQLSLIRLINTVNYYNRKNQYPLFLILCLVALKHLRLMAGKRNISLHIGEITQWFVDWLIYNKHCSKFFFPLLALFFSQVESTRALMLMSLHMELSMCMCMAAKVKCSHVTSVWLTDSPETLLIRTIGLCCDLIGWSAHMMWVRLTEGYWLDSEKPHTCLTKSLWFSGAGIKLSWLTETVEGWRFAISPSRCVW